MTETWSNPEILDTEILPNGYNIYWRDYGHQRGGVLLAAVNSLTPCKHWDTPIDVKAVTVQLVFLHLFLYVFVYCTSV